MTIRTDPCKGVRFQVLTAASMNITVFWDIAPCSLVEVDRRLRIYCLLLQGGDRPEDGGNVGVDFS
jgi:hypothetical protein